MNRLVCMYLKLRNFKICVDILKRTNGGGKIRKSITHLKLTVATLGSKRIILCIYCGCLLNSQLCNKQNLSINEEIIDIADEYWPEALNYHKLKYENGNRVATCKLNQQIPSFLCIGGVLTATALNT